MSILFVLVPLALILATVAVIGFTWAVGRGEFEDLETPAVRVIFEDDGLFKQDQR